MKNQEDIKKYFIDRYKRGSDMPLFYTFLYILFTSVPVLFIFIIDKAFNKALSEVSNLSNNSLPIFEFSFTLILLYTIIKIHNLWSKKRISGIISEFEIYSLKDDVRTKANFSGSFFLGIGTISGSSEEIDYYVFYKKSRFGLVKDKLPAEDIEVIQRDDIKPCYKEVLVDGEQYNILIVPINTIKRKIELK